MDSGSLMLGLRPPTPAVAFALALTCASCVSASAPGQSARPGSPTATAPTRSPSPSGPSGPRLTGTISVTGGVQLTSSFSAPAALDAAGTQTPGPAGSTCAQYAMGFDRSAQEGGGRGFDAPEVHSAEVNHQSMYVSVSVATGYTGPSTYDSQRNSALQGYAGQDVENPSGVATTPFDSHVHDVTTLTVNPDGSASLNIVDWGSTEVHGAVGAGGVSINASITWVYQQ